MNRRPIADIAFSLAMIVVAALVLWGSQDLPPATLEPIGPAVFPIWAAAILAILSAMVLLRAFRPGSPRKRESAGVDGASDKASYRRRHDAAIWMAGLSLIYLIAMDFELLGFRWATTIYAFLLTFVLFDFRLARLPAAIAIALILGVGMHAMFTQIFFIDLP